MKRQNILMNLFFVIGLSLQLGATPALSQPDVQFNRQVTHDRITYQLLPGDTPPPIFVFRANFQRLLGENVSKLQYDTKTFHTAKIPLKSSFEAINITANGGLFMRNIYITQNSKIVGYVLNEYIDFYDQQNPVVLPLMLALPQNVKAFSKYIKQPEPGRGRIEVHEQEKNGYIEQYILWVNSFQYSDGERIETAGLLLDAFYPKEFRQRLEKPIGRAIARQLRSEERFIAQLRGEELPIDELDQLENVGPEMD